ncbi:MAG: hypothetical protein QW041_01040 [Candidatus Pacearchaeota archaeon]
MAKDVQEYKKKIIKAVENTIKKSEYLFKQKSTLYGNEYDIINDFCHILKNNINLEHKDKDGKSAYLLRREYATPFKCSMKGLNFEVKPEDSRYGRGKYGILLLNPEFVEKNDYLTIRNQDYRVFKKDVKNNMKNQPKPIVLYGLEFMFLRDPIRIKEKNYFNKTADDIIQAVLQDAEKLKAGKNIEGFIEKHKNAFLYKQ